MEELAASAVAVAAGIVGTFSPLGGVLLQWAGRTAFAVYDLERAGRGAEAAQLAGDRVAVLVADLKFGPRT